MNVLYGIGRWAIFINGLDPGRDQIVSDDMESLLGSSICVADFVEVPDVQAKLVTASFCDTILICAIGVGYTIGCRDVFNRSRFVECGELYLESRPARLISIGVVFVV